MAEGQWMDVRAVDAVGLSGVTNSASGEMKNRALHRLHPLDWWMGRTLDVGGGDAGSRSSTRHSRYLSEFAADFDDHCFAGTPLFRATESRPRALGLVGWL